MIFDNKNARVVREIILQYSSFSKDDIRNPRYMATKKRAGNASALNRLKNDYKRIKNDPIPLIHAEVTWPNSLSACHYRKIKLVVKRTHRYNANRVIKVFSARSTESASLALLRDRTTRYSLRRWILSWQTTVSRWLSLQTPVDFDAHSQRKI